MATASPSTPSFSASFCCKRSVFNPLTRCFPSVALTQWTRSPTHRLVISSRVNSKSSGAGGSVSPDNGDEFNLYEMPKQFGAEQSKKKGSSVFVMLPVGAVEVEGKVRRKKIMFHSLKALAASGVEGVVIEVWWGLVERDLPQVYNWQPYLELVEMAEESGLKVRAVLAFHQCGNGPEDPYWVPLPRWVLEEIDKNPDLAYCDRFGRRNKEYISLGCDTLPVLRGRSPIQAYADFMRNFRDTFRPLLGGVIAGIQVGMGPAGELRYPSCPSKKLAWAWHSRELGEFQCYDKYMLASLHACAHEVGMHEWGSGGPIGAGSLIQDPENSEFFRRNDGSWNTPYGKFFLEWYSGMLLLHGQRICMDVENIFRGIEMNKSAKVAGIHWHYGIESHPSELTAGYYNTSARDGFLPITEMFSRYRFTLCCSGFEKLDMEEKQLNPLSSPEDFLRQLLWSARICRIPVEGENSAPTWDHKSFQQVLKMRKFYSYGLKNASFSFNFVRMDKHMFEGHNWISFTRFVRQMSDDDLFRAKLEFGDDILSLMLDDANTWAAFACG
ncbi:hypothetical protein JCGZ_20413 [Jatropha curcas]|uniref:Beta-amylase n=1 Tax=Jatropha curcas TaxID=180498 RepID=A0A067JN24_JATCU|nr:beta-amylase 3, chloroplastic [Jatropha curcas]KDP25257.1 hypothetical protein JCGZ_20413 [Jatropha curcas]